MTTTAAPRPDHLSADPRPGAAVGPDAPGTPLPGERHRGGLAPAAAGPRDLPASSDALAIAGLVPMSSCDWPGKLVATVFAQGCPWNCTYCHNPDLIPTRTEGVIPFQRVRDLIAKRAGLLDGVVFSGGEPTRQRALGAAMREVRDAGFGVGLHTGGAYPARLREIIGLVDWVGLDIKAPRGDYAKITRVASSGAKAFESLDIVLAAGVEVQVRTTVDPTVLSDDDVARIRAELAERGIHHLVLQEARPDGTRPEYAEALLAARRAAAQPD
ncbi:MAG: anaerobic ribonucleoside-triphosphate reductase activating protein [Actinomycetales bacterium]|nr:anaerobic ribonucleoside-triphosphate reductase activating protein [Actinomycetales bacterium]